MKRGAVTKRELAQKLVLERKMLNLHHVFTLDHEHCVGCGLCVSVCPEEAPKLSTALTRDGRLVKKPLIGLDASKCTFCGECVVVCPTNAIKIEVNGKERIPVVEAEAFPTLTREIMVDVRKCDPVCDLACQEECPMEAIDVIVKRMGKEAVGRILDVKVNKKRCIFCGRCEVICPRTAVRVIKPIEGSFQLNTNLCPAGCRVCVDVCPSKAIALGEDGKPLIIKDFCIYCGACQEVCPERAVVIKRKMVLHTDIKSGAWIIALEKLTSYGSLVKELSAKSQKKLRERAEVIDRF